MSVTITIPEEVAELLGSGREERQQRACESIALELYREGKISLRMLGKLAGVGEDYWAADAFRVSHGLPLTPADHDLGHDQDERAIQSLLQP